MLKKILIAIECLFLLVVGFGVFVGLSFSGTFDTKYSREELVGKFSRHEKQFKDAVGFFRSKLPRDSSFTVSFDLQSFGRVSLWLYPEVVSSENHIIGADRCRVGSSSFDTALTRLGWTQEDLRQLREKLEATGVDHIRSTGFPDRPVEAWPSQNGWGSFTFVFYDAPLTDSAQKIHGTTISNSSFGKTVLLSYSSAL